MSSITTKTTGTFEFYAPPGVRIDRTPSSQKYTITVEGATLDDAASTIASLLRKIEKAATEGAEGHIVRQAIADLHGNRL